MDTMASSQGPVTLPAAYSEEDSTPLPGDLENGEFLVPPPPPPKVPVGVRVLMVVSLVGCVSSLVLLLIAYAITPLRRHDDHDMFKLIFKILGIGLIFHLLIISTNVHKLRRSFSTAASPLPLSTSCFFEGITTTIIFYFGIHGLHHGFRYGNTSSWPQAALIIVMAAAIVALICCFASLLVLVVRMVGVSRGWQWAGRAGRISPGIPVGNFRVLFSVHVLKTEGRVRL